MSQTHYYTFRLRLTGLQTVEAELSDPARQAWSYPKGVLRYNQHQARLAELHRKARAFAARQPGAAITEGELAELGEALFDTLFDETLRARLYHIQVDELPKYPGAFLRLEVDIPEREYPQLAALPWEFLRAPAESAPGGPFWLGSSADLILTRRRRFEYPPAPLQLQPGEALRIALAVSSPSLPDANGEVLPQVKHAAVWDLLNQLKAKSPRRVEIERIMPATLDDITRVLHRSNPPHIFHYLGHARLNQDGGRPVSQLALTMRKDLDMPDWVGAENFSEPFLRNQSTRIVFLQACESALGTDQAAFISTASAVVQRRVPVVVAMQYEISQPTASQFVEEFYKRLLQDPPQPVDRAVQLGRQAIGVPVAGRARPDFANPVMYMCVEDGELFTPPPHLQYEQPEDAHIYATLRTLNYDSPVAKYVKYTESLSEQVRVGAFLIAGPKNSEPDWLLNRLVCQQQPAYSSDDRCFKANFNRLSERYTIENLWQELSRRTGMQPVSDQPEVVAAHIASQVWDKKNVYIVFRGVDTASLPDVIDGFWRPLATQARQCAGGAGDHWLMLFVLMQEGAQFKLTGTHRPYSLELPPAITAQEVFEWMKMERANLPDCQDLDDDQLEARAAEVLPEDAEPAVAMMRVCDELFDYEYEDGVKKWLTL